ncbi:MAG: ABC transporter ATP-binding protein [Acidimicrobiia bacterium]
MGATEPLVGVERPTPPAPVAGGGTPAEFEFDDVTKEFAVPRRAPFVAVRGVDLRVETGSFVCLVGPSGCGKSTLLNMAAGLMEPTEGDVRYRGVPISRLNTDVGYVTQQNNLLPWRTLERNVGLALEIQGVSRRERKERIAATLERVGLSGFGGRYPAQLSGGMQKRASLARILIYEPATLLMDEPFGPLDAQLRLSMQRELVNIWERDRKTVIFVTHDLEEAILLGDKVVVFGASPGRVIHVEDVDLPRPRDIVHLRSDPAFLSIWARLWDLLEAQIRIGAER